MNIQTITKILTEAGIEEQEANREVELLLEKVCNISPKDKILGKEPDKEQLRILEEKARLRADTRLPVQYIIGEAYFMGEFFKVTPDVLIPRDETEILVGKAVEIIKTNGLQKVLDIGTGSGCIACTIANRTNATVLGIDISSDALRVALDNVTKLGINNRAVFRKSDLFEKIRKDEKFDMIISNPPYIPIGTKLEPEVLHEPQIALFAEENGLSVYKRIINQAPNYLSKGGWLIFELGMDESKLVKTLMEEYYTEINIIKDLSGIDRVISGRLE